MDIEGLARPEASLLADCVLMYGAAHRDRMVTIGELAEQQGLSNNHLRKVVNDLARQGLLETTRGRGGGLRLLAEPKKIRIGDVVRATEADFRLVACFDTSTSAKLCCDWSPMCRPMAQSAPRRTPNCCPWQPGA